MKILALEVSGVRVYREFRRIEFSSGLNVFVGPNRAGKTSLADALAAALYGTERARSSPLAKSNLQSWPKEDSAGKGEFRTAVEVESGEERFRLERDLNAGRARLLASEGNGWRLETADARAVAAAVKELTGIDRGDLFLATAYLRQGDLARIAEEGNLVRMGEILRGIVSGVPLADVSEILARLRSGQKDVKSEGVKGLRPVNPREYDRMVEEREKVQGQVAETEETFRVVLSLSERKAALERKLPEVQRRLEELRAFLGRWKRKTGLEKELADADGEADSLGRRLRRLREIREELKPIREALGEVGDAEGLVRAVTEKIPSLRAERDAAEKRLGELRREIARIQEERQRLLEESSRLEVFGINAQTIEERLPVWEESVRKRKEAPALLRDATEVGKAGGVPRVPSWGKIAFAFALFLLVIGTPFLYWGVTGDLPPYLFALFGLGFPVLLWAVLQLNRRLLGRLQLAGPQSQAGGEITPGAEQAGAEEDPEERMAALFRMLGIESAEDARAGLRKHREVLAGLKASGELSQRTEKDLKKVEGRSGALETEVREVLNRFGVENEDVLLQRQVRAQDLLRRREDLMAREKELLAEGTEEEVAARLDGADRRRRDLGREAEEEGLSLFNPSSSEVEAWCLEEETLGEQVEADRTELIRIRARLEEKVGEGFLSVETLRDRLDEIDERLRELDLLHQAYGIAAETLEEAARELEDSYLPRLQEAVEGHFRSVVGRDFGLDLAARWPAVTVALPDNLRAEPRELSRGTADQLYLAMRAACVELLGGDNPLPLILDDPFVHYDDASRQRALAWLRRTAARTQVFLLAAREEYADWAERTAGEGETRVFRLDPAEETGGGDSTPGGSA